MNEIRPWRTIHRRTSRQIMVGNVAVGGDAPITVQTMTNTPTSDAQATIDQIRRCEDAGADIIRVSCPDTESTRVGGTYPLVGWLIVAACVAAAAVFVKRALDDGVQARVDERGVYAKRLGAEPVALDDITGFTVLRAGIQRIARFERRGAATFGINTTFYDRGIADLVAAVRQHRPDLAG